ncbi:hypothetical protein HJFPF1_05793 [Paramyrothecium foliicola]|nr:hypothetical protein HJFPF1_05793 [Paramyrothecium foliicola]
MAEQTRSGQDASEHVSQLDGDAAENDGRSRNIISDDTMPAIIELLVLDELEATDAQKSRGGEHIPEATRDQFLPQSSNRHSQHVRQVSQGKVMTAAQFEMYRNAVGMHSRAAASDDEDSQDEYDDKDEDEEQKRAAATKQRQRQQAYLKAQRLERSKISGGEEKKQPEASPEVEAAFEGWNAQSRTPSPMLNAPSSRGSPVILQDDDDDVPLALLIRSRTPSGAEAGRPRLGSHGNQLNHHNHQFQPHRFVERPQTRLRSHSPGPQLHSYPTLAVPSSHLHVPNHGMNHQRGASTGLSMSMGNHSLMSLGSQSHLHPQNYGLVHQRGASMGLNMGLGNHSLQSLSPQPQMQRPHSSGGLIAAIDHLQSPSLRKDHFGPPKDFLGMPVNPPKFYGRWT